MLLRSIREQEESSLARRVLEQQWEMGWPGLSQEVTEICNNIGIGDVNYEFISKDEIKDSILHHHHETLMN